MTKHHYSINIIVIIVWWSTFMLQITSMRHFVRSPRLAAVVQSFNIHKLDSTMTASTNSHRELHQLWSPVLLLFKLLGFATYTKPASTRFHHFRRLFTTLFVACVMLIFSVYTLLMKISFYMVSQVNVMSDQFIYLTVLPAHLISLFESLAKYRQTDRLFQSFFAIVVRLRNANGDPMIDMAEMKRSMLLKNWSQVIILLAVMALGIWLTGMQAWIYYRWILLAQLMTVVRLIEVSMHVELLSCLMGALESFLLADVGNSVSSRYTSLQDAAEIYRRIHRHAEAISAAFGWSILASLVYTLNSMINTSFWLLFTSFTSLMYKYKRLIIS